MRLLMMRHGATEGNAARRYVGRRTDEPLSEAGREQCLLAGSDPRVQRVYASPMQRAQQTARLCFPFASIEVVPGLEEFDFGAFEGRTAGDMTHDDAYRAWVDSGCTTHCPGGDSRATYMERTNAALMQALYTARQREEDEVVVVAHGGTIMAALHAFAVDERGVRIDQTDTDYFNWQVGNACGYTADVDVAGTRPAFGNCRPFTSLPLR